MAAEGAVEVRYINGEYLPCKNCKYLSVCVVPARGKHLKNLKTRASEVVFECLSFEAKTT